MAASPAAAQSGGLIDPHRKAQYTLQISDNILDSGTHGGSYSSVRMNHKPKISRGNRTTKLRISGSNTAVLDVKDREDNETSVYHYEGTRSSPKKSYVLVFDQNNQTASLQPLTTSFSFNVKSTPKKTSQKQLAEQYPQISEDMDESNHGDSSDQNGSLSDGEPDLDNPFDFRHFLDGAKQPRLSVSPALAPIPKVFSLSEMNVPRERSSSNPEAKNPQKPAQQRPMPKIRMERKASTRPDDPASTLAKRPSKAVSKLKKETNFSISTVGGTSIPRSQEMLKSQEFDLLDDDEEDEDGIMGSSLGGLEIDFGDEGPPSRSRVRALTLPGSSRGGPISLRSAANSPSSQINTPRSRYKDVDDYVIDLNSAQQDDEDEDADADISDDDEASPPFDEPSCIVHAIDAAESDGDDDVDVEPMSLGSPVHGHERESSDDMEQDVDLAEGVWAGLAESGHVSTAQESESESEAE